MSSCLYSTLISNIPLWEKSKYSKDFRCLLITDYSFSLRKTNFPGRRGAVTTVTSLNDLNTLR